MLLEKTRLYNETKSLIKSLAIPTSKKGPNKSSENKLKKFFWSKLFHSSFRGKNMLSDEQKKIISVFIDIDQIIDFLQKMIIASRF